MNVAAPPPSAIETLARRVLAEAPAGALPDAVREALRTPTLRSLLDASSALMQAGSLDAALALFQSLAAQDGAPPWAAAGVARVAQLRGHSSEAARAWEAALNSFPNAAQAWWYAQYAAALRASHQLERAQAALDELAARFPDEPASAVQLARAASNREDWPTAAEQWARCIARYPGALEPSWFDDRARALFRQWRAQEALDAWAQLIARFPEYAAGTVSLVGAAREIGHWDLALRMITQLIERRIHDPKPEWYDIRAKALLQLGQREAALAALADADARFPQSPLASVSAIEVCNLMRLDIATILPQLERALQRFPGNRTLLVEYARSMLACGRFVEADDAVARLEAGGTDHHALIARWRLVMDRESEAVLRARVPGDLAACHWGAEAGIALARFLLELPALWSVEVAMPFLDALGARFPGRIALLGAQVAGLIALQRDEEAMRRIDAIPPEYRNVEALMLRAWAAGRRGEHARAKGLWHEVVMCNYYPALHSGEPALELVKAGPGPGSPTDVTAFVMVRNEMLQLPRFLAHYRGLGVRRFVFLANNSTDDGPAYLCGQADVTLYRTGDSWVNAGYGMRWINTLMERHGDGGWCLFADADEMLIYPGWERAGLRELTAFLDSEGAECLAAYMLDVYPERLLDASGAPVLHDAYVWCDADYGWIGQIRPPYVQPFGGVRRRLLGGMEHLHKVPLVRHGCGSYINNHNTTHLRLGSVSGAFLHYKLLNMADAYRSQTQGMEGNPFWATGDPDNLRRHVGYATHMGALLRTNLVVPGLSIRIDDSLALADRGLMHVSAAYRDWLSQARSG